MQYLFIGMKQYIDERICPVCGVDCKYPSKLKRHLQSAKHQLYEASCVQVKYKMKMMLMVHTVLPQRYNYLHNNNLVMVASH